MYSFGNADHSKWKEIRNYNYCLCINNFFLAHQIFCFHFQNCGNPLLIKKSLKVECRVEACRTCRILGNLGEIKYKTGISAPYPVSFLKNQLNRYYLFIILDPKK